MEFCFIINILRNEFVFKDGWGIVCLMGKKFFDFVIIRDYDLEK